MSPLSSVSATAGAFGVGEGLLGIGVTAVVAGSSVVGSHW